MLEKTKFRLMKDTLGIAWVSGERTSTTIPANAIVEVRSCNKNDRLVDVFWDGKTLMMFVEDLRERGHRLSARNDPAYAATVCEENLRLLTGNGSINVAEASSEEAPASKRTVKSRRNP
jgi:hypothetical protein